MTPAACRDSGAFAYHEPDARASRICAIGESAVAAGLEGCAFARVVVPLATPAPRGYARASVTKTRGYAPLLAHRFAAPLAGDMSLRDLPSETLRVSAAHLARHENLPVSRRSTKGQSRFLDRSENLLR